MTRNFRQEKLNLGKYLSEMLLWRGKYFLVKSNSIKFILKVSEENYFPNLYKEIISKIIHKNSKSGKYLHWND